MNDAFDDTARRCASGSRRALVGHGLLGLLGLAWPGAGFAQGDKAARIVSGFPAGAGMDPLVRMLAEKLRGPYASTVIVENRTGAGGRIAAEAVKALPADGSVILFTPASPMTIFPSVYRKLGYDPFKDFVPVTTVFTTKLGLIVGPGAPVKDFAEYREWLTKDAKNTSYGSPGAGTMPHFLGSMFSRAVGIPMTHIAYRGGAAVWQDLLGGQLPAAFSPIGFDSVERHKTGKARVLAIAEPQRTALLPDVPTFAELGFKSLQVSEWFGLFLPAGASAETVQTLNRHIKAAMAEPDIVSWLTRSQSEPSLSGSQGLAAQMREDTVHWKKVVAESGFTSED